MRGAGLILLACCLAGSARASAPPAAPPAGPEPPGVVDLGDAASHSGVTEGVKRFGEECAKHKEETGKLLGTFRKAASKAGKGLDPTDRKLQRGLLSNMRLGKGLSTAAKGAKWLLDKVNVVAVVAKTAGRASEGDLEGAAAVLTDEGLKRGAVSLGSAAGSGVPVVGTIAGALAAEEAHKAYVAPEIYKKADALRVARAKGEKYGEKMKRGPQDDPPADPDEPPTDPGAKTGDALLQRVSPQLVRAVGKTVEDASANGIANTVTTTFSLQFFNVGALAPGYAKAILVVTAVSSLNGATDKQRCVGRFSGGPDGGFRMRCEDGLVTFRLVGGQRVLLDAGVSATVDNPGAFADWPR